MCDLGLLLCLKLDSKNKSLDEGGGGGGSNDMAMT